MAPLFTSQSLAGPLAHGRVVDRGTAPLFGRRAVYGTIAAVENFVDMHYKQQIEQLQVHGGPESLLPLLRHCQADEQHHRDEAAALADTHKP